MIPRGGKAIVRSDQEWLEAKNQTLHNIDVLLKRWEQRITLTNLGLVDRFFNLEIHIILHLRRKDTGEQWGVCIECPRADQVGHLIREPWGLEESILSDHKNKSVLVNIVQFMDTPERIIPAFVWFEPIDSFYRLWPDTLYFSSLLSFVSVGILRDRKLYSTGGRFAVPNNRQLICEVVESTPQTMDDIPRCGENFKGINRETLHVRGLRVILSNTHIQVFVPAREDYPFEVTEVLFGPFNFYAKENQTCVGGKCHRL